ncbi:MAG: hypothetical protein H6818_13460 [Phycisphaerales bacterium]|nr:hypothetical protein [Phycisphaerales bacterium]MCB9862190.1 hypothetical protein [Phycisphaerales bacterium]
MAIDIKPGSKIKVTLEKAPSNEAASKTLARIFRSNSAGRQARRVRKALRTSAFEGRQRGGRIWRVMPKAPRLCQPEKGTTCELTATTQLIRDLNSVERFVKVS